MLPRLLIFDCDGVLFHSEQANLDFYNEVLRRLGEPPLRAESEAACHALSSTQLFEKYYGDRPELLDRLKTTAQEASYEPFYPLMQPRERLGEILSSLRLRFLMAMATNRGRTASGVLQHFGLSHLFDLTVGVLDVERPKPHPDMLLKCLSHFDLSPDAAVYVGDQPGDAVCARTAGVCFVAYGSAADSDHRITTLEELEDLVDLL